MKFINLCLAVAALSFGSPVFAKDSMSSTTMYENTVLTFANGSSALSADEMEKLHTAVKNAQEKGKITRVEVAVWSDKDHPATGDLPKADRRLAEKRIETIRHDLKEVHKHVRAYNMAENAHWVGRNLHSSEAQLDAVFAKRNKNAVMREDFERIKEDGAPSKAVVIFRVSEK